MDDDLIAKLTRSPLEEPDEPTERRWRRREPQEQAYTRSAPTGSPAAIVGAVLAGGLLVLGGWALARSGDDEAPATTLAPPPTTVAVTAPPPLAGRSELPAGYTAVNDRLGVRPERILQRGDLLFVSLTTAVRSGLEAAGTAGFAGGRWELEVADGRRLEAADEAFDPLVPGALTVAFPIDAYDAADVVTLHLTGEAVRSGVEHEMTVPTEGGFPWSGVAPDPRLPLDTGLELVAGQLDLDSETGVLRWELAGPEEFTALVSADADVWGDANAQFPLGRMEPAGAGVFPLLLGGAPSAADQGRSGEVALITGRLRRGDVVSRVEIRWIVNWIAYSPAEAEVPLTGVPVAVAG